jgi:AraC-like DNA-binding protein
MVDPATGLSEVEWFRPSGYDGELELLIGAPSVRSWSPRLCEGFEIVVLIGTPHVASIDGLSTEVPIGTPYLIPSGTVWSAKRTTAGFFTVELGPTLFSRLRDEWPARISSFGSGLPRLALRTLGTFWRAHRILRSHQEAGARSEALLELLAAVFQQLSSAPPRAAPESAAGIERVRALLHEYPARDADVEQLARLAGVSIFQFVRAFKRRHGVTPRRYRDALRVARARRLLATDHPVGDVVAALGFSSEPVFRRLFEHSVGVRPERYAVRRLSVVAGSPT